MCSLDWCSTFKSKDKKEPKRPWPFLSFIHLLIIKSTMKRGTLTFQRIPVILFLLCLLISWEKLFWTANRMAQVRKLLFSDAKHAFHESQFTVCFGARTVKLLYKEVLLPDRWRRVRGFRIIRLKDENFANVDHKDRCQESSSSFANRLQQTYNWDLPEPKGWFIPYLWL